MFSAVARASPGLIGGGLRAVFTLQNRQPRVHVSPMTMMVAVAVSFLPPQHSPMLGHLASSQTVANLPARRPRFSLWNSSPPGICTLSQSGFG
eukprot:scaffold129579_cov39-Tisochrysis_lutea.AAC.2